MSLQFHISPTQLAAFISGCKAEMEGFVQNLNKFCTWSLNLKANKFKSNVNQ